MFGHYLLIGWRHLRRSPLYSFINVLGLAIGVAACVLIFLFVQDEVTYDRFHTQGNNIYRLTRAPNPEGQQFELNKTIVPHAPMPLGPAIAQNIPGVRQTVRVMPWSEVTISAEDRKFGEKIAYADPNFFDVFSFGLLRGDPTRALAQPTSAVLSQSAAIKFFGSTDIIGRVITVSFQDSVQTFEVSGVLEDYPNNSSIQLNILLPLAAWPLASRFADKWSSYSIQTYVLLEPTADPTTMQEQITRLYVDRLIAYQSSQGYGKSAPFLYHLQPLFAIHFDANTGGGKPVYSYILSSIAFAVLLIACINFVTMTMARSTARAREVSMRKVFGAVRLQLVRQFWGEGLILATAAIVAGLVLVELALPVFNNLVAKSLDLHLLANWQLLGLVLGLLMVLALSAGSVPAIILSRLQPASILHQQAQLKKSGPLARSLVVIQYSVAITLLICLWGMLSQQRYIHSKPLGYSAEHVAVVANYAPKSLHSEDLLKRLRLELADNSHIVSIAGCSPSFVRGWNQVEWTFNGSSMRAYVYKVDANYVPTLKLELIQGRNFSDDIPSDRSHAVLINEAFARKAKLTNPVGAVLTGFSDGDSVSAPVIIGVIKDYHFVSLHEEIEPSLLCIDPTEPYSHFLIRVDGTNLASTVGDIESAWNRATANSRFQFSFLDDDIQHQYEDEQRWTEIIGCSASVAVVVASLGLFGLAGLSAVRRMKEIGIRKVLGASMPQVLRTLNTEFLWLIIVANVVAWPAAYFILSKWLQSFAYRTTISVWTFVLSALVAVTVAVAAISYHTIRAASTNPAGVLRHE